jgi:DNA-binding transcriptional ArsR family regulator
MIARRQARQTEAALAAQVGPGPISDEVAMDSLQPGFVEGVFIRWVVADDVPARDKTAFWHAVRVAMRLHKRGYTASDTDVHDSYLHAYGIAMGVDKSHRSPRFPTAKEFTAMATRVRAKANELLAAPATTRHTALTGEHTSAPITPAARKAAATLGRRGGQTTAARLTANRDHPASIATRERWTRASKQRADEAMGDRGRVLTIVAEGLATTGDRPTAHVIAVELGVTQRTVQRHLAALVAAGLVPRGKRGRKSASGLG